MWCSILHMYSVVFPCDNDVFHYFIVSFFLQALVERGRYFIKQEDVIHLKQTDDNEVKAEFR